MPRITTIALAGALATSPAWAGEIDTSQGMKELGGAATIDIFAMGGTTQVGFGINPRIGYFVIDNLEVLAGIGINYIADAFGFGFNVGAHYFIPLESFPLYLGGTVGYGRTAFMGFGEDNGVLSIQGGVLPPLADNIGLDLGLRVDLYLGNNGGVHVPLGYFGVRSFFR